MLDPRWLASQLLERDLVTQEQILAAEQRDGDDFALNLVATGAIVEADLLRTLGLHFRTRYVTTEKLGQAQIPPGVLEKLSLTDCERTVAVPVKWEPQSGTLSVVAGDPGLPSLVQQIEGVSGARKVEVYVGLPSAVKAAQRKWYKGDIHAFSRVERSLDQGYPQMLDMYDQRAIDLESPPPPTAAAPAPAAAPIAPPRATPAPPAQRGVARAESGNGADGQQALFQMTELLVGLIELPEGWRQGHALEVARMAVDIGERMGLPAPHLMALRCASLLHDLGKPAEHHLTVVTLQKDRSLRRIAHKVHALPRNLHGQNSLPPGTLDILDHLYERPDGAGVPGKAGGASIPVGSKILAIADAFCDLLRNPATPSGRCSSTEAAIQQLREAGKQGAVDPNLVELLPEVLAAPNALPLLGRSTILVVDPNVEDTALLEYRLVSAGFDVRVARTTAAAARLALAERFNLVLCEVETSPVDGFNFVERMRADSRTRAVPVVFTSSRDGELERQRAREVAVDVFLPKPLDLDEVIAKARMLTLRSGSA